jgi:phage shock protein C
MLRSFSDRVFGGVCGGIGAALRINPWVIRVLFAVLTILTLGGFLAAYVLLWWIVPQQSFVERKRGVPTLLVLLIVIGIVAIWVAYTLGAIPVPVGTAAGVNLFWVGALVILSAVFFLRQLRG